jgi:phosphoacetylglucosamine mutase
MGGWHLLDGDKIAVLLASFLREEVNAALPVLDGFEPSFAAIQTAYANGASTKHLRAAGVPVEMTATGVKHLHHAAAKYDLGVYFEANGHGTVLFSDAIVLKLRSYVQTRLAGTGGKPLGALGQTNSKRESTAARRLLAFHKLSNQGVGDALSDMLLVESVLRLRGWSVKDWNGMYTDLPSRQAKLSVKDRTTIVCTNDETRVISPASLQAALDAAVSKYGQGRCFVRPSGTEDAVRVYAEAESQESADALALDALVAIHTHASGVGELPTTALQS